MSDSVLKQAQVHLEALRRAHGGAPNPALARSVAIAAGLTSERRGQDQFPLAGLALAGEAAGLGEVGSAITGLTAAHALREEEEEGSEDASPMLAPFEESEKEAGELAELLPVADDDEEEYEQFEEPTEYEEEPPLAGSAAGGTLTSTPPVDFGESGTEEIVERTDFRGGRRATDRRR